MNSQPEDLGLVLQHSFPTASVPLESLARQSQLGQRAQFALSLSCLFSNISQIPRASSHLLNGSWRLPASSRPLHTQYLFLLLSALKGKKHLKVHLGGGGFSPCAPVSFSNALEEEGDACMESDGGAPHGCLFLGLGCCSLSRGSCTSGEFAPSTL